MPLFDKDLLVFHDNNTVFADVSFEANNYTRDSFGLELIAAEDFLYIGLFKRFNAVYIEMSTVNTNANTFSTAAFSKDGGSFTALTEFKDDTKGFTRSGFISWTRKQTDWDKTTINGEDLFWVRLKPSADHISTTAIQGLNIVFSDDNELLGEFRTINDFLATGDTSFITYHQAARDHIVQMIRNRGKSKTDTSNNLSNITKWDLLDKEEIAQAAKHLALSKIFFSVSDGPDDKWYQRYRDHESFYNRAFDVFFLTLDKDDDGTVDTNERLVTTPLRIQRV